MFLAKRNQYGVPRLYSLLTVLIANFAAAFEDVDFMFPVVLMKGRVSSRFDSEMAHKKIGSSVVLIDKPLYPCSLRTLFGDRRIRYCANVHFVQVESPPAIRMIGKINDTLKLERFILSGEDVFEILFSPPIL